MPQYPMELLDQALQRARRLVSELEARKAEVEANPPPISVDQLAMGRQAMTNAIESARRMLVSLEDAWESAVKDLAESSESDEDIGEGRSNE